MFEYGQSNEHYTYSPSSDSSLQNVLEDMMISSPVGTENQASPKSCRATHEETDATQGPDLSFIVCTPLIHLAVCSSFHHILGSSVLAVPSGNLT